MFNPEAWTSEAWLQFAQDHWVIIAAALVAIFIIVKLVKTVLKWVLVAAVIFGIVAYGGYSIDDLKALGTKVETEAKDQAIKAMAGEASQAEYTDNQDGTYSITTPNLEISGVPNTGVVSVKYKGISLGKWKVEGAVRTLIEQSRATAKA
jgi:nitrogen regulatory protein PII-like uncharacterized protein